MQREYAGMSYEAVVRKYAQTVATVCLIRLNNWADAEDCFQNTFLKLYTTFPDLTDENHLKAWLIRVAINECSDALRTRRRFVPLEAAAKVPVFMDENDADAPEAMLMKLKPKYREAMYLYYCEAYKIDEVADILKKSPNTVKTLLRRGREQFKKLYGGDDLE